MTAFKAIQLSGYWKASPYELYPQVVDAAKWADIIVLTEVSGVGRRAVLARVPGFELLQDRRDPSHAEVAILVRSSAYAVKHWSAADVGEDPGPIDRVVNTLAVLRKRRTWKKVAVSITHLPAGVEGAWEGFRGDAHRHAVSGMRRRHFLERRHCKLHAEIAFADWNLNLHRAWVREWVGSAWPGLNIAPTHLIPKGGTHAGGRLIDWFVSKGLTITSWSILPKSPASDHQGIRVEGRF